MGSWWAGAGLGRGGYSPQEEVLSLQAAVPVRGSGRRMYRLPLGGAHTSEVGTCGFLSFWGVGGWGMWLFFQDSWQLSQASWGHFYLGVFLAVPRNPRSLHSYYLRGCFFLPLLPVFFPLPQSQSETWPMSSLVQSL